MSTKETFDVESKNVFALDGKTRFDSMGQISLGSGSKLKESTFEE